MSASAALKQATGLSYCVFFLEEGCHGQEQKTEHLIRLLKLHLESWQAGQAGFSATLIIGISRVPV